MRFSLIFVGSALAATSQAYPGMKDTSADLHRAALETRAEAKQLLGDLKTLKDSQLTQVGKDIKAMLLYNMNAQSATIQTGPPVGTVDSAACKADPCCVWKWIALEMTAKFNGTSGRCTKFARGAVRLGFHDAAVWSNTTSYGGADGSILLTDELSRADNNGLATIADATKNWYNRYKQYGISMADLIQFGANVATVVCPFGPRIRTYVGRKDNAKAGPTGLLPDVNDSADKLIKLFQAKTIDPHDLVALVGAHSTSQQHFVDTGRDGDPQDSTPGEWDVAFYGQTTGSPPPRVMKFNSDIALSKDSRTQGEWQQFVGGQAHWNEDYAKAYLRMSMLGVNNINSLTECTKVLPAERPTFVSQDKPILDLWLQGQYDQLNNMVDDAIMLTGVISTSKERREE
ncbi:heme peroxidase [Delitschia confertaspora ATCC 74209]|uniref:Peroxidase n=1 Tax=Delitschia confertaspora ATCC 74209 TaxID=1513339 RepID=A0A9P4JJH5_9PLEO|nr:heme peroxidase [Delitschia confertaspora ATCC 74209]